MSRYSASLLLLADMLEAINLGMRASYAWGKYLGAPERMDFANALDPQCQLCDEPATILCGFRLCRDCDIDDGGGY